jgi:hypothetical protein
MPVDPTDGLAEAELRRARNRSLSYRMFLLALLIVLVVIVTKSFPEYSKEKLVVKTHVTASVAVTSSMPSISHPPADIELLVANGTNVVNASVDYSNYLAKKYGYKTLSPVNSTIPYATSVIYYLAGERQDALTLASYLNLAPTAVQPISEVPPVSNLGPAELLLVLGNDLANIASNL